MPKLNRILWSLAILFIVITTVIFSFVIILVGAATLSLYGLYRHYFPKKKFPKHHNSRSQVYTFGEIIDVKSEVVHDTIDVKKLR
ncbi:hypothetical protein [Desulfosporosinus shakirovi]|uniref:hypothetical protein n=1 Tax=Desulfosporosinus shakirovi TaxID=2885154 RepID=UPI001E287E3D|nr:hypothetical protein [Desulfosporosinus sp. SRJS8]MCB8814494.1 hypothetical protein [Desulfosporosinus sp. SRJS8]